ncbi:hypothetical protein EWM64_g9525 [Hericium alpestre]|uniref:PhoD-like phosphatase domain-containing protein n=1 Tax=Hericium alpestre TaxID=135208 RepID=A0A4Y9ZI98_9AGAM|nr:hypothetical protein EWM64_g9525 [Hericium alpestre]
MDSTGWHAQRRAAHANDPRYSAAQRGPDGRYQPVEQVYPLDEGFVGGFKPPPPSSVPPPVPEKDNMGVPSSLRPSRGKRTPSNYTVPPPEVRDDGVSRQTSLSSYSTSQLTQMSAVERSHNLRVARMNPQLQFMCGPLLRYDTVDEEGVWNGAALIVTADAGSTYDPHPMLTYRWDPERPTNLKKSHRNGTKSFDLGPHPADPMAAMYSATGGVFTNGSAVEGPNAQKRQVPGQELWVYVGNGGTFTFWRFLIQIPLSQNEMKIRYTVNNGLELEFVVPARNQNMRLATYSCNGFSAGVNADDFRSPGFASGYDPVWVDLLSKHAEQPFHALVGGGDQIYCDGLTREPELQEWVNDPNAEHKRNFPLTQEILSAIDRFYFNHYCHIFRSGAFARANSSIPMMNMADDHDLIDGFGSYPDDLQRAPVFRTIGSRGYFFFLLFQCFINDELDGTSDERGAHVNRSIIIGATGPYIPSPSHSFLSYLGPTSWMLMLDCRAERELDQVCSPEEYRKVFARLHSLPPHVEHLIVQLGIPIAYPRMVFLETMLGSKFNPLTAIGRAGSLGLKGFVNKFNADAELLDDLAERNWLIEQLQLFAQSRRIRVSFLSGDVHCAAVGILKTLPVKKAGDIPPSIDHRYMINVVTSAIVNTPPPNGVLKLVSSLSTKTHRTMHYADTDETMMPIFVKEPDGSPAKSKFIMGRRNWCSVILEPSSGDLLFDIRVEKMKGYGETFGYIARAPAPRWNPMPAGPPVPH